MTSFLISLLHFVILVRWVHAGVIEQYTRFVKARSHYNLKLMAPQLNLTPLHPQPAFDQFIKPSQRVADLIIPWHGNTSNIVAIDLITEHIRGKLQQHEMRRFYPNLEVIASNFQTRCVWRQG